jgi:toxin YoeB
MELIYNELSFYPLANDVIEAEERFNLLIQVFKKANVQFGFKDIRFQKDISTQLVTTELNYIQVIQKLRNNNLKNALLSFLKPPYLDDLTSEELDRFYESEYKIINVDCPVDQPPFGLPIAYIKNVPTISIHSDNFWRNKIIEVCKVPPMPEEHSFNVYNICLEEDISSEEIINWADRFYSLLIDTEEKLTAFLSFRKFEIAYNNDFFDILMEWKESKIIIYKRTLALMKDVEMHPFSGGLGRTENLKNRGKEASKRITHEDRLSYSVENNIVTFLACKGHYDFH